MILKLFPICSPAVQENQLPSYLFTLIWFHFIPTSPYRFSHWQRFPVLLLFSRRSEVKPLSRVRVFATPWTVTYQAPPSMEFSRQEYWSGLPFPSPGDLPHPGIESRSVCIARKRFTVWATRDALWWNQAQPHWLGADKWDDQLGREVINFSKALFI